MSAHTLLGQFIIMLRLEDHTRCLVQLCSSSVIMSLSLCTPVLYGILLLIVHTLCLAQFVVQLNFTYTHLWGTHFAWIGFTAVHLYFSPVSAHSWTVCTTTLYNCTLGSLAWPLILYYRTGLRMWDNPHEPARPITGQLWFTCFALIGPLSVPDLHLNYCMSQKIITCLKKFQTNATTTNEKIYGLEPVNHSFYTA